MKLTPSFLDGAFLTLNGWPDALVVVDSHRCEMERAYNFKDILDYQSLVSHEGDHLNRRRIFALPWTSAIETTGSEDALGERLFNVARLHPGVPILLVRSLISNFIYTDIHGVAESIGRNLDNPMLVVDQKSIDDDWLDGWVRANDELVKQWKQAGNHQGPLVKGFFLQRLEGDETGNLEEIQALLTRCGVPDLAWPGVGQAMVAASGPGVEFVFPYSGDHGSSDEKVVNLPLPMGLRATREMLVKVARVFGLEEQAEVVHSQARKLLRERLKSIVPRRLSGLGAVTVGDPWRVLGLNMMLEELGIEPVLSVVLQNEKSTLGEDVRQTLAERGEVLVNPDGEHADQVVTALAQSRKINLILGSAALENTARKNNLPTVETGHPSQNQHFTAPTPVMGYKGLLHVADRIMNAVNR